MLTTEEFLHLILKDQMKNEINESYEVPTSRNICEKTNDFLSFITFQKQIMQLCN